MTDHLLLHYKYYMRLVQQPGFEFLRGTWANPGSNVHLSRLSFNPWEWMKLCTEVRGSIYSGIDWGDTDKAGVLDFSGLQAYYESQRDLAPRCIHEWVETEGFSRRYVDCRKCKKKQEDVPSSEGGTRK